MNEALRKVNDLFQQEGLRIAMCDHRLLAVGDLVWAWRQQKFVRVLEKVSDNAGWIERLVLEGEPPQRGITGRFMLLLQPVAVESFPEDHDDPPDLI